MDVRAGISDGAVAASVRWPRRSWLDWLLDAIDRVPLPRWATYLAITAVLGLVGHLLSWWDGSLAVRQPSLLLLAEASYPLVFLLAMRQLDGVALLALERLRPVMTASDAERAQLARSLTTTPAVPALLALVVGCVAGVVSLVAEPSAYGLSPGSSPALWVFVVALAAGATVGGLAFATHAVLQLRTVSRIHAKLVEVRLFELEPLYAFSRLTSWTGITLLAMLLYGVGSITLLFNGELTVQPTDAALEAGLVALAVACFVVPLLGLHRRIDAEKDRRLGEAQATLEAAMSEVRSRIAAAEFDGMGPVNDALTAARTTVATVSAVSTWPWRPDTLRAFVSALVVPVVIWAITAGLSRVLGG